MIRKKQFIPIIPILYSDHKMYNTHTHTHVGNS